MTYFPIEITHKDGEGRAENREAAAWTEHRIQLSECRGVIFNVLQHVRHDGAVERPVRNSIYGEATNGNNTRFERCGPAQCQAPRFRGLNSDHGIRSLQQRQGECAHAGAQLHNGADRCGGDKDA